MRVSQLSVEATASKAPFGPFFPVKNVTQIILRGGPPMH